MRRTFAIALAVLMITAAALAGTLSGKVSGASGVSVVYVDTIPGKTFPAPEKHVLIDQKGLLFQPHIAVVQQGATVDFQNSDNVAHNVFWPAVSGDKKAGHNLGTWPKGEKKSYKFDKAGVVPLLCNVHPEMSGYVVVSPTPYYAETDASGNYKIANVPDGDYKVVAWHEGAKPSSKPVKVSGDTKADLTVSK
ncbi:MAG: carboxypeptidase regulatory-like domain-containing protein [Terriglobales bacterium]